MVHQQHRVWNRFVNKTQQTYGLDYSSLNRPFHIEKVNSFLRNHLVFQAPTDSICCSTANIMSFDMHNASTHELSTFSSKFQLSVKNASIPVNGILVWFDVELSDHVTLSTSPYSLITHWRQTGFLLDPPILSSNGVLEGIIHVAPKPNLRRFYDVEFEFFEAGGRSRKEKYEVGLGLWARNQGGWIGHGV